MDAVEWIRNFQVKSGEISHTSFMGSRDLFTISGKLYVPEDRIDEFYEKLAACISMNIPIFFSEIPTPVFPFIEDIDIFAFDFRNFFFCDPDFKFLRLRVEALKSFCPEGRRNFQVFCASGVCLDSGIFKTSIHLVWPDLLVNAEIAEQLRLATIKYFKDLEISSPFVAEFGAQAISACKRNSWENIFDETAVRELNGLRMPFSDKISRLTGRVERRPLLPVGIFSGGSLELVACDDMSGVLKRASCRRRRGIQATAQVVRLHRGHSPLVFSYALHVPVMRFMELWDREVKGWWDKRRGAVIWKADDVSLEVIVVAGRFLYMYGNSSGLAIGSDILSKVTSRSISE